MSSTNRGANRIGLDRYYTPDALAVALLAKTLPPIPVTVLEPHGGGGAFIRAAKASYHRVLAMDLDPGADLSGANACLTGTDYLTTPLPSSWAPEWVVGNPPYKDWEAHAEKALQDAPNVAFLLRLAALESRKRYAFWQRHPLARLIVLAERPAFTGQGTDSCAYGFFVWQRGHTGTFRGEILSWR
jgi:hypothetical protein